jgi:TonB-linked SusC/RagA family outer membrane protein
MQKKSTVNDLPGVVLNCLSFGLKRPGKRGLLLSLMKVTLIQMTVAMIFSGVSIAFDNHAQEVLKRKVSLEVNDISITQALAEIEKAANVKFVYSPAKLDLDEKVSLDVSREQLGSLLAQLLTPRSIGFKVQEGDEYIILVENEVAGALVLPSKDPLKEEVVLLDISGTVTDDAGNPIPGVNIIVKGTTKGTTTDSEGKYTLSINEDDVVLVFSFIGYAVQEVPVNGRSVIDVQLQEDVQSLDEVVVVGYGTQKRANVTGAVSTVSGDAIAQRPLTNTAAALQGTTPGLSIKHGGGAPGEENVTVRIRGVGTLNNSNPLVLVDGIEQSLSTVEPQNIESVTVLKDAASSSIYGSRAANGVILITTKRGAKSGTTVSYDVFAGIQNPTYFPEKTDPVTWLKLENEAQVNAGGTPTYSDEYIQNVAAGTNPLLFPFADWEKGIFNRNAVQQRHSLSISSGGEAGKVFASLNYSDTDGILQNFNNKQMTMRINTDLFVSKKLTLKTNLMYRNRNFNGPGHTAQQIVQGLLHTNRPIVMEYPDGTYDLVSGQWNPRAMVKHGETSRLSDEVVAQAGFAYHMNEALSLEGNVTMNSSGTDGSVFMDGLQGMRNYLTGEPIPVAGWFATSRLTETQSNSKEISQRLYLNYSKTFDKHLVEGMAGYEEIYNRFKQINASRTDFFSNELRDLSAGNTANQSTGGFSQEWRLRSFFGRVNYSFNDKYMLQANVRYDGSSRFGEGNRWGLFPSFSAGWRISEESFMRDNGVVNTMRLRASWGQLGNQNIGLYRYLDTYNLSQGYQFNETLVPGAAVTSAGNRDITWETSTMTNIGLDLGFMDDRLEVIAEYFQKYTDDILLNLPIPRTIGVSPPVQNAGAVSNKGWEIAVNYRGGASTANSFQYSVGINFSDVVNKIEDLKGAGPFFPDKFSVWTEGASINSLRGLKSPGLYMTQEDLDRYPALVHPSAGIGDIIYEDLNGDGVISQSLFPGGDQYIMANEDPRFEFGANFSASFRGFDFSMFWQGVGRQYHTMDGALIEGPNWQNFISQVMAEETFHPERNPNGSWPLVTAGNTWNLQLSDFWIQDTRYVRLKNFQLGYTIPQKVVSNLRVYISGENMITFTPTKLFDPETPRGRSQFFPHSKVLSAGLNVKF